MASSDEFLTGRVLEDVSVVPCKGWFDMCEYCDKRFGDWVAVDGESLANVPEEPGFLMFGLQKKKITEVVSIVFDDSNIRKEAYDKIVYIKAQIYNKKNKATKSTVRLRWLASKNIEIKEISTICAHWYNNGILPSYQTTWPGLGILNTSSYFLFSKTHQKWCYRKKDPVWRKSKAQYYQEMVKKCKWTESCEICDSLFTPWVSLWDVLEKDLIPDAYGVIMVSFLYAEGREVLFVEFDEKKFKIRLRNCKLVKDYSSGGGYPTYLRKKPKDGKYGYEFRWMVINDDCYDKTYLLLLAHWLNVDDSRYRSSTDRSVPILSKNKNFKYMEKEKKWYYMSNAITSPKSCKEKNRRQLFDDSATIDDEYLD